MRPDIAKFLMLAGAIIFLMGIGVMLAPKTPWIGRLPGDIDIKGENFRIYFPMVTCLILSILLTILFNIINIFKR